MQARRSLDAHPYCRESALLEASGSLVYDRIRLCLDSGPCIASVFDDEELVYWQEKVAGSPATEPLADAL